VSDGQMAARWLYRQRRPMRRAAIEKSEATYESTGRLRRISCDFGGQIEIAAKGSNARRPAILTYVFVPAIAKVCAFLLWGGAISIDQSKS
jgi:hypothetical protein